MLPIGTNCPGDDAVNDGGNQCLPLLLVEFRFIRPPCSE
jgi:hypothetical protein